jgi:hypothetical protein
MTTNTRKKTPTRKAKKALKLLLRSPPALLPSELLYKKAKIAIARLVNIFAPPST